jgi:hypothetical protein
LRRNPTFSAPLLTPLLKPSFCFCRILVAAIVQSAINHFCVVEVTYSFFASGVTMVESSECSSILERFLFSRHTHPSELRSTTSSIYKMHTSLFNPSTSHHQHHHKNSRQQQFPRSAVRTTALSPSSSTSSMMSLLKVPEPVEVINGDRCPQATKLPPNLEADKIQRNSLYLTFNAPQVDDYVSPVFSFHMPSIHSLVELYFPTQQLQFCLFALVAIPPFPRAAPHFQTLFTD